ncbi:hypothetical protein DRH29_01685 [candidate division Kazan bacterium]|uniref:HTH deoR-type domain-containing protein n=1 Tax=candidate division Kazan bacterium TaxID=2202143 RepID=A0A420ZD80_UNCK3|nr:MAG: hypothetical protein DRH29_01685 [candidate division Kazan bacterium]
MYYLIIFILLGIIAWLWVRPGRVKVVEKQEWQRRRALEHLKKEGEITNEQYRKLTGVSQSQATRDLDELEKQGLIRQIGKSGPKVTYKLTRPQ